MIRQILLAAAILITNGEVVAQNWEQVGGGLSSYSRALYSTGEILIAGKQGGVIVNDSVAIRWNGENWSRYGDWCGLGFVASITEYQDEIIYSGACGLATWDGMELGSLVNNANSVVFGLSHYQDELVATGWFDTIGGIPASKVARWNGSVWAAIDNTQWEGGAIGCAIEYQGNLYVGGNMIDGELDIDRIGRWDGTQWNKVGNGIRGGMSIVSCFQIYQGDLYVGGRFTSELGNPGPSIARWDGEQWLDIGGATSGPNGLQGCEVRDMVVFNDELFAVGDCSLAGGIPAHRIAKWDGHKWCGFGDVFNGNISSIEVHQGELYIGGDFTTINGNPVLRVAKWVGGDNADTCGTLTGIEETPVANEIVRVYPNPATSTITISTPQGSITAIALFDVTGRAVNAVRLTSTDKTITLDVSSLPAGIYFGRVLIGELERSFKWVKQ